LGAMPGPKMVTMAPGATPGAKLAPLRKPEMVRLGPGSLLVSANDAVKVPTVAETEIGPGELPAVTVMEALPEASVLAEAAESVALPPVTANATSTLAIGFPLLAVTLATRGCAKA